VSQSTTAPVRPSLFEVLAVAALLGVAALAVLVTYARVDPVELYHVSQDGLAGGLGRTFVLVNYPIALVAIAVTAIAADRLDDRRSDALGLCSILLCGLVAVPGVVDQDDLDARWVNLLPALGVALAAGLAVAALRDGGVGPPARRAFGDPLRIGVAAALLVLAVPWYFAEAGFYAPDPILADEVPAGETIAAVHLGHHHGTDGVLLALSALALSRTIGTHRRRRAEAFVSGYLALMLAYGCALAIEDDWGEQVWKRGWTDWDIPGVLRPELSPAWAVIAAAAVGVELLWFRRARAR
jgi:hypothetical protein